MIKVYDLETITSVLDFDYWPDKGGQMMLDRIEREWITAGADPEPRRTDLLVRAKSEMTSPGATVTTS